jgi:uncharacterized membrane protein YoaK (UPF0700 family)
LIALTAATGVVDAVSYLGLGRVFTANMTGNVVLLGFGLGGSDVAWVAGSLTSLAAFIGGAVIGGRVTKLGGDGRHQRLMRGLAVESALIVSATIISLPARGDAGRLILIGLLAAAMGVRNATVRRLAEPDLTTTVLTLTLTGLVADSRLAGGSGGHALLRGGAVIAMLVGAVIGALLVREDRTLALAAVSFAVMCTTIAFGAALRIDRGAPTG